ncbi:MAG: twin-arginine translocase TatA/TatE family subunit [Rikenellaceae bacterium]
MKLLFVGGVGFQEIVIIMLIVLLFFGGKKIPELMRGLGQGVRSFKDGVSSIEEEIKSEIKEE